MIIVIRPNTPREQIDEVIAEVQKLGYEPRPILGTEQTVIAAIGDERTHHTLEIAHSSCRRSSTFIRVQKRYKLVSRESQAAGHHRQRRRREDRRAAVLHHGRALLGGKRGAAPGHGRAVKAAGATILRGGAYKPRTSPYEFQGLGKEGLRLLALARKETASRSSPKCSASGTSSTWPATRTSCKSARATRRISSSSSSARAPKKPILLKRGMSERIEEWLLGAEYILADGNPNVLLCERGIRTFETYTRNTLDLAAVAIAKKESHLPVIVDPSQGCGRADLVRMLCRGAVAMGADGLLIEVHPNPAEALSDGQQQVDFDLFNTIMNGAAALPGNHRARPRQLPQMKRLPELLERNRNWARRVRQVNPDFFKTLSRQQAPKYMWIGCADSRVPATEIVDLAPGEIFVHRNVANVVVHSDFNCLSVLEFAVDVLKVEHVIVVGHYGCGGVRAAMDNTEIGLADNWLGHVRDVKERHKEALDRI